MDLMSCILYPSESIMHILISLFIEKAINLMKNTVKLCNYSSIKRYVTIQTLSTNTFVCSNDSRRFDFNGSYWKV